MGDDKKSTDPRLSAAERKDLPSREAKEAFADHEEAQRALQGNLERLHAAATLDLTKPLKVTADI